MPKLVVMLDERTREALVRLGEREGLSVDGYVARLLTLTAAEDADALAATAARLPVEPSTAVDHELLHKHMVSAPQIAGIANGQIDDILIGEYAGRTSAT